LKKEPQKSDSLKGKLKMANSQVDNQELQDRLSLIETMIAEGRRKTESWGWTFVLWGAAYAAAIVFANLGAPFAEWTTFGHRTIAWPVTMMGTMVLMFLYILLTSRKNSSQPETTMGRAIYSIWIALGISMFLLLLALGISGRLDQQGFVAVVSAMLGMTNAASSIILKWRAQFLCAVVWWASAVTACFCTISQSLVIFLIAIFLCQIVFGAYGMVAEARERKAGKLTGTTGTAHA
jgi:hypothetical protein